MSTPANQSEAAPPADRMERTISTILGAGLLTSLAFVLLGVGLMFVHHPEYMRSTEALGYLRCEEYKFPTTLGGVFKGAMQLQGRSVILLGVFVLFLTPVLRVAFSVIGFAREKNWAFTLITCVVLTTLLLSLVLGGR